MKLFLKDEIWPENLKDESWISINVTIDYGNVTINYENLQKLVHHVKLR